MALAGMRIGEKTSPGGGLAEQLRAAVKRDPRRAWLLAILVAILVFLWAKPSKSLSEWANEPTGKMGRNLFSVPYDYYPQDPAHPPASSNTDNGSAKSASTQADQLKERQILIENLREQAAGLTLEGTVLGQNPRVWINGVLVGLGQPIGDSGFRVAKIESRRVFIERDGVQIVLSMK